MRVPYRAAKKVYRMVKHGPTLGTTQYLGRQVWRADRTKPGGNYSNPKSRRR